MYAVHAKIRKLKSVGLQDVYPARLLKPGVKCHLQKKNGQ